MKRDTFLKYIDAYNNGDLRTVTSYYADDLEFDSFGIRRIGSEATSFLEGLHQNVKDKIVPRSIDIDGDVIDMDAEMEILALVDLPKLPAGAMKKGERRTVGMKARYETNGDTIRRIYIVGKP